MRFALLAIAVMLSGCAALPDSIGTEIEHVSHPLAGPPFGPMSEEDGLSQLNVLARWERGRWYTEHGLGINLQGSNGGGFYGPPLTYTGRVGVQFKLRD